MSELYDKMSEYLVFNTECLHHGKINELAKDLERLAIQAQVELLNELKNDTENTNAKFRLKLATMINELESQLK